MYMHFAMRRERTGARLRGSEVVGCKEASPSLLAVDPGQSREPVEQILRVVPDRAMIGTTILHATGICSVDRCQLRPRR